MTVSAVLALAPVAAALFARGPRLLGALLLVGGAAAVYDGATTPEPAASVASYAGALVSRCCRGSSRSPSRWVASSPPSGAAAA